MALATRGYLFYLPLEVLLGQVPMRKYAINDLDFKNCEENDLPWNPKSHTPRHI
jgi:hypothetical protein